MHMETFNAFVHVNLNKDNVPEAKIDLEYIDGYSLSIGYNAGD